jgi:hypothetical protein
LPLYTGTILAVLHEGGGAAAMALSFRKVVRLAIPAVPKNLSTWGGRELPPLLLVVFIIYIVVLI